ncbi:MAG TPA: prepilin-type N-terminal cleavage/methylation domain-containing protein [Isosphaeraceae bacterium]|nr:prepilin-type N-terminal cleavage/methylation domain-containing protein [Isosphaeraceae bacterium]
MQRPFPGPKTRRGFTLVELAVVIVIIGVLAAFGVPKFLQSVEKSKATEAFNYWSTVQAAEERYIAQNGVYASVSPPPAVCPLDIVLPTLQYFTLTNLTATQGQDTTGASSWTGTLTRISTSSSYGPYTVGWTQNGFDPTNSTIPQTISPVTGDLGSGS